MREPRYGYWPRDPTLAAYGGTAREVWVDRDAAFSPVAVV